MAVNTHVRSFNQFNPLYKLNSGVGILDAYTGDKSSLDLGVRLARFVACMQSFRKNVIRLQRLLDSISSRYGLSYKSKDRKRPYQFNFLRQFFGLENDLLLFFIIVKILLDDMALFVPFYYKESLGYGPKNRDLRDIKRPLDFQSLKKHFYDHQKIDANFVELLKGNDEWIDEICDRRKFLVHRFHDLSAGNDFWTHSYYVLFYEFTAIKGFIPNVLIYVAKIYYSFVRFTIDFEEHFKNLCQNQFPRFEYFYAGCTVANAPNKTHLFFAGLGRLLRNDILIRIHPKQRERLAKLVEYFMREENVICRVCNKYKIHIRATTEHYVVVSSCCDCGTPLPISLGVERRIYPHFMDQSKKHIVDVLIPHQERMKILRL